MAATLTPGVVEAIEHGAGAAPAEAHAGEGQGL